MMLGGHLAGGWATAQGGMAGGRNNQQETK
jgi:hypothetical protein